MVDALMGCVFYDDYFLDINPLSTKNITIAIAKGGNAMAVPSKAIPIPPINTALSIPPAPDAIFFFEKPKIISSTTIAITASAMAIICPLTLFMAQLCVLTLEPTSLTSACHIA